MGRLKSFGKQHPFMVALLLFALAAVGLLILAVNWLFFSIDRIEPGELLAEEVSPGGEYTVRTYLNNGGATVDYAVLGVLHFNQGNKNPRNIYWQYKVETGAVEWHDADTVRINGQSIDVPDGKYDYRRP